MNEHRIAATQAAVKRREIEQLEGELEEIERPLCQRAHEIAKALHLYTRAGQYPWIDGLDVEGIVFSFSNGIDIGDDGSFRLTYAQLNKDPAWHAHRYEQRRATEERRQAAAQLRIAQARAKRAGIG